MIVAKLAATAAIVLFGAGHVWRSLDCSCHPGLITAGERYGGALEALGLIAGVVAVLAWIWGH